MCTTCSECVTDVYVGLKTHLCNIHTRPCTSAHNTCKVHVTLLLVFVSFVTVVGSFNLSLATIRLARLSVVPAIAATKVVALVPEKATNRQPNLAQVNPYTTTHISSSTRATTATSNSTIVLSPSQPWCFGS